MAAVARNRRTMKLLPIIHEVKSRCCSHDSDDDDDEHDDQDDGSVADGGYDRETKLVYFRYAIVALFFLTASKIRLHDNLRRSMLANDMNRLGSNSRRNTQQEGANAGSNFSTMNQHRKQQHRLNSRIGTSDAPLFFHISPGSTGSRTLYHAACTSGFPSVHHKSFCISRARGIDGVPDDVVRGVRSHYEVLRLYSMAFECCKLWSKGKIKRSLDNDQNGVLLLLEDGETASYNASSKNVAERRRQRQHLCNTPLHVWTSDILSHLLSVIKSGVVGLFDTPYPYLSTQVLQLANEWRKVPPIVAMTERDPKDWARSRLKNHGMLLCREEYSYERIGASEFDLIGCYERALSHDNASATPRGSHSKYNSTNSAGALNFWDVFWYRSHHSKEVDPSLQEGMEFQMMHHQELYLPVTQFAPDFFGVHLTRMNEKELVKSTMSEKDVAIDIKRHTLGGKSDGNDNDDSIDKLRPIWRDSYSEPLTCRGRVDWIMETDTMEEYYHIPKTCVDGALTSTGRRNAKLIDDSGLRMTPTTIVNTNHI